MTLNLTRETNRDYLAWLRSLPCSVTGRKGTDTDPIDVCHLKSVGSGGSDFTAIPMLHSLHMEQHQMGIESFFRKYGDLRWQCFCLIQEWEMMGNEGPQVDIKNQLRLI